MNSTLYCELADGVITTQDYILCYQQRAQSLDIQHSAISIALYSFIQTRNQDTNNYRMGIPLFEEIATPVRKIWFRIKLKL